MGAHAYTHVDARKGVASLRKKGYVPRPATKSPTATSPDDYTLLKRKESPYWYSYIIFIEENAPQTKCQGAYLHKNFATRMPYKKAYQYRAENMKKLRKIKNF